MKKVHKLRIYPNQTQIHLINETLGCCRYIMNMYIAYNKEVYEKEGLFVSGYDFSKLINKLKKNEDKYSFICNYSSKAIKDAIMTEEKAFKSFFKRHKGYPHFKSRKRLNKESFFFIKDNIHYINKNIIKIPILGKVRITESNYLPSLESITSGRVIKEYNKYYVMFIYDTSYDYIFLTDNKLGIDVGIKYYVTISNDTSSYHINHFKDLNRYKSYNNKITKLQEIISNKANINYNRLINRYYDKHGEEPNEVTKNIMKGESYNSSNIRRLQFKARMLKNKQRNIRTDYINKLVYFLTAKTKPSVITIENLDISEMIKHNGTKDATLHKYINESSFYTFKVKLTNKCKYYGIRLREANKYFGSSKTCSCCGNKIKSLTLNDRIYHCNKCGLEIDRDINASINLLNLKDNKCKIIA